MLSVLLPLAVLSKSPESFLFLAPKTPEPCLFDNMPILSLSSSESSLSFKRTVLLLREEGSAGAPSGPGTGVDVASLGVVSRASRSCVMSMADGRWWKVKGRLKNRIVVSAIVRIVGANFIGSLLLTWCISVYSAMDSIHLRPSTIRGRPHSGLGAAQERQRATTRLPEQLRIQIEGTERGDISE